jgi:hypothetical protein
MRPDRGNNKKPNYMLSNSQLRELLFFGMIVLALSLLSGCCAKTTLGLKAREFSRNNRDYCSFWIPFGFVQTDYIGLDLLYLRRDVAYSKDLKTSLTAALNELLGGPTEEEQKKGAVPLVSGRLVDCKILHHKAIVRFSNDFSPSAGSLAVDQARIAIEEVVRQFLDVTDLKIEIDGVPDDEVLQP